MDIKKKIGLRIKAIRAERKLNQSKLAERIGKVNDVVSNVERGVTSSSLDSIESLCKALDVTVSELFEDIDTEGKSEERHILHAEIIAMTSGLSDRDYRRVRDLVKALTEE